jgi:hypothetical protein
MCFYLTGVQYPIFIENNLYELQNEEQAIAGKKATNE